MHGVETSHERLASRVMRSGARRYGMYFGKLKCGLVVSGTADISAEKALLPGVQIIRHCSIDGNMIMLIGDS